MPTEADRTWQHPWLRVALLLRTMLHTRWDPDTGPRVKVEFKKALVLRSQTRRAGWFNKGALDFSLQLSTPMTVQGRPRLSLAARLSRRPWVAWPVDPIRPGIEREGAVRLRLREPEEDPLQH